MFLIISIPPALLLLWCLVIRPYCRRNGKGYTTGANIPITAWVDWQQAGEMARANNDRGQIFACRLFLLLHILLALSVILFIVWR